MRIYWYWPFARPEELPLACATVRDDDVITVHVIDRDAAPAMAPCRTVVLRRDLPDVRRDLRRSPAWVASRAVTYGRRAWGRERVTAGLRPEICHLHYLNRFTDWLLPRPHGTALVMSVHDVTPHVSRLPRRAERALLTATYRRAHAVIVHHERLRRELLAAFELDERRVHVVPHQVFAYGDAEPAPLPERPCVLFFGALRANKGVGVLLQALAGIPDDITVRVAGRGDAGIEADLRRAADRDRRLEVEIDHVPISRKIDLFRQASVVVLPYTSFASQSGVLHDAYAHGRPVIVSDVGALGETVREDGTGLVVVPGDAAQLARSIEACLSDQTLLARHAERALDVREERSPAQVGMRLRNLYAQL